MAVACLFAPSAFGLSLPPSQKLQDSIERYGIKSGLSRFMRKSFGPAFWTQGAGSSRIEAYKVGQVIVRLQSSIIGHVRVCRDEEISNKNPNKLQTYQCPHKKQFIFLDTSKQGGPTESKIEQAFKDYARIMARAYAKGDRPIDQMRAEFQARLAMIKLPPGIE